MTRGGKIVKSLEVIAIIILIISFLVLAYCVYISFNMEKSYAESSDYEAKKTATQVNESTEEKVIHTIEDTTK